MTPPVTAPRMASLTYPAILPVEHSKSTSGSAGGSTHDFIISSPSGEYLFALETESRHVQRIVKLVTTDGEERKQQLAKIEWRGNRKDLVQMGEAGYEKPMAIKKLWDPPIFGERYVESFTGADGDTYTWSKVVIGKGKEGIIEVHLTHPQSNGLIAKYTTPKLPDVPHSLLFGIPGMSGPTTTLESTSTLELFAESARVGDMLFITFLVALGRAHASTAFTLGGFLRQAMDTFTMNMI